MLQTLLQILRHVPLLGFRNRPRGCPILKLPNELLCIIFAELCISSKACLALTCKFFFERFGTILDDEGLDFPYIEIGYDGGQYSRTRIRDREELLLRLQGRWQGQRFPYQYCRGCFKLHLSCGFIDSLRQMGAYCTHYGTVTLCPHYHLNAREKIHRIQQLEMGSLKDTSHQHQHSCTLQDMEGITVKTTIGFRLRKWAICSSIYAISLDQKRV